MAAIESRQDSRPFAIARPHQTVRAGERVVLDGSSSYSAEGKITSFCWKLPDGKLVNGSKAETVFAEPGAYVATLRIKDDRDREDVDFCTVKVFTADAPEATLPTIFMTHHPAGTVAAGEPVFFQLWLQARSTAPIRVDLGDGKIVEDYTSYTELKHTYLDPGIYVVRASATVDGVRATCCQKVRVCRETTR
jgi:hypothetical protein